MNISFADIQITPPRPPPHQSGDVLKVSELEEQIANEYRAARRCALKKEKKRKRKREKRNGIVLQQTSQFVAANSERDCLDTSARDPVWTR